MKQIMEVSEKKHENLKKVDDTKHLIDVSGWGEFQIIDLFDMSLPKGDLQIKKVEDGDIPLITPSNFNNGMLQRISEHSPSTLYDKGSLTVDMFGNTYYQDEEFFVTAHGHVNVLLPKTTLNVYTGTFLASAIKAMFFDKYGFNEMCTLKVLKAESIKLPITSAGEPNWAYMESYMKQIMEESEKRLENLKKIDGTKHMVDVSDWGDFRIDDIFEVVKGTRLTKADMKDGTIKFVGSSAMNNGETHRISNTGHLHPANTITVCYNGSVGETFYQDEEFWASDDVNVLYPKFEMTRYMALFICPIIRSVGKKYAFIDKWKQEDMKNDIIKLPITSAGKPDWQYMGDYMKQITDKSEKIISDLQIGA